MMESENSGSEQPSAQPTGEPEEWAEHEHVAPEGQLHAQRLLASVGNPELAKLAIEKAHEKTQGAPADDDQLAQRLGYVSMLELFEASTPVPAANGKQWCVAPLKNGTWVAWERRNRWVSSEFASKEAAIQYIHDMAGAAHPPDRSPLEET